MNSQPYLCSSILKSLLVFLFVSPCKSLSMVSSNKPQLAIHHHFALLFDINFASKYFYHHDLYFKAVIIVFNNKRMKYLKNS